MESVLHVLRDCPLPQNVWNVIIKPSDTEVLSSTGFIPWLISNLSSTASIPWLIMFGVVPGNGEKEFLEEMPVYIPLR
jgi:hypothetical protein